MSIRAENRANAAKIDSINQAQPLFATRVGKAMLIEQIRVEIAEWFLSLQNRFRYARQPDERPAFHQKHTLSQRGNFA
ncbi:MAG: hypothetical protein WCB93_02005 [Gallionella sp.]